MHMLQLCAFLWWVHVTVPNTPHLCLIVKPCLSLVHTCAHDAELRPTALSQLDSHSMHTLLSAK